VVGDVFLEGINAVAAECRCGVVGRDQCGLGCAFRPVVDLAEDVAGVFAVYCGVQASEIGEDCGRVAHQVTECVDPMDTGFVDEEAFHCLKVGLAIQVGVGPLTVSAAHAHCDLVDLAERFLLQHGFDLAVPRLEAEVFVDDERGFGGVCCVLRGCKVSAEWFLADDGAWGGLIGKGDDVAMGVRWGRDVDNVGGGGLDGGIGIGEDLGVRGMVFAESFGFLCIRIDEANESGVRITSPSLHMEGCEEAGSYCENFQGHWMRVLKAFRTAVAQSLVFAVPPRSGVRWLPSTSTSDTARRRFSP